MRAGYKKARPYFSIARVQTHFDGVPLSSFFRENLSAVAELDSTAWT